ncbi:hypothetical protein, partial [Marinobacter alexandrii]|uniref:hypothetical protein n=2 Tax=Marinobacter alexandrii TaxID=2570351 RepID=UPI003263CFF3
FPSPESAENQPAYCLFREAHSTANRASVNRFLKNLETQFLQQFQTVALFGCRCVSGLSLRRDAHSTDLLRGVNGDSEKNSKSP